MNRVGEHPTVATVQVSDELDLATTPALRVTVENALAARPQTLALDLGDCPFAGVDALHALVELTEAARRQGTTLVLVGLRPILRRAISLVGLDDALLFAPVPRPRDLPAVR